MPILVAVFIFERVSPFHLSVPCVVFGEAARSAGLDDFEVRLCSEDGDKVMARDSAQGGLETLDAADIVIFPSWPDPQQSPPRRHCWLPYTVPIDAEQRWSASASAPMHLPMSAYWTTDPQRPTGPMWRIFDNASRRSSCNRMCCTSRLRI